MKIFNTTLLALAIILISTSCSNATYLPVATNTINSISLSELNLDRDDYEIMNTISATASIEKINHRDKYIMITETSGEFYLKREIPKKAFKGLTGSKDFEDFRGVLRAGFLSNDYVGENIPYDDAEFLSRGFAIYRIINLAQEAGADGIIEPIISTNYSNGTYETTVSAKLLKLKVF